MDVHDQYMELDDEEEEDMVAVEAPNMWSKGKGVQDASVHNSVDHRETYEIIDDQDIHSEAPEKELNHTPATHQPTDNTTSDSLKNNTSHASLEAKATNETVNKPSGRKKTKYGSTEVKEEIIKNIEYDFKDMHSEFSIVIVPKKESTGLKTEEKDKKDGEQNNAFLYEANNLPNEVIGNNDTYLDSHPNLMENQIDNSGMTASNELQKEKEISNTRDEEDSENDDDKEDNQNKGKEKEKDDP